MYQKLSFLYIFSMKIVDIFTYFVLGFQTPVRMLHSQTISIWIRHISKAQHVASSHHPGPCRSTAHNFETFCSEPKSTLIEPWQVAVSHL